MTRARGEGSLYQRSSDGKWVGAVTLDDGRRRVVYGDTQSQALEKLRAVRRAVEDGLPVTGDRVTVGSYLDSWLTATLPARVRAGHMKASTLNSYGDLARLHIIPAIGGQKLATLKAPTLRRWLSDLQDKEQAPHCMACARLPVTGARCPKHVDFEGKPLSARTVAYCHAILRAALGDAVRDEIIGRNVAQLVEPPACTHAAVKPLSHAEAAKILATAGEDPLRALWLVMLGLGLRRGEALALRWENVDLDAGTVKIVGSLQRLRGERDAVTGRRRGALVEVTPKTEHSAATMALPALLVEVLREHRRAQRVQRLAAPAWVDDSLVFTTRVGTALEPRNVSRSWAALCLAAGVRPVRLHDLRHSAASFALAAGVSMKVVQTMLRHSRMATTADIYAHVLEDVQRAGADRMDGVLRTIGG
ncbi:MAG TPA: tyrosine-type recombinase/integrase [Acidothermaceae bacterium]